MGRGDQLPDRMGAEHAPARSEAGMMDIATTRAAQEVQAAMVIAKRFPRDEDAAYTRIMKACKRKALAEQAMYAYPRGSAVVTGASIRLAEELARDWGNIDFGIIELEQNRNESTIMAYAWDLETNTRQTKIFSVPHVRFTRDRGKVKLVDPRDIYEMTANQGARRLRACILGVVPGDVQEAAVAACEATLAGGSDEPLGDRIRKMVVAFSEQGVTKAMIEERLGHVLSACTETELVQLRKVFLALRDNMASRDQFFTVGGTDQPNKPRTEALADKLKGGKPDEAAGQGSTAQPKAEPKAEPAAPPAAPPAEPADNPPEQREVAATVPAHCDKCGKSTQFHLYEDGGARCQTCGTDYPELPEDSEPAPAEGESATGDDGDDLF